MQACSDQIITGPDPGHVSHAYTVRQPALNGTKSLVRLPSRSSMSATISRSRLCYRPALASSSTGTTSNWSRSNSKTTTHLWPRGFRSGRPFRCTVNVHAASWPDMSNRGTSDTSFSSSTTAGGHLKTKTDVDGLRSCKTWCGMPRASFATFASLESNSSQDKAVYGLRIGWIFP